MARAVARVARTGSDVVIAGKASGGPAERYVPATHRVRSELGVRMTVDFEEALTRTMEWHRARGGSSHGAN